MPLTELRISNFRNLQAEQLSPATTGLNIITGDNGSGKTSLLEAIYYLGHGRSFRSSNANRLIRHETDKFSLYSQIVSEERALALGVERQKSGDSQQRIAEQNATVAELAAFLPMRIINSQSHQLFESGPNVRRKYLDWGLFYQFPGFFNCWRQFEQILKQRNAVLRDKRPKSELKPWTDELVRHGLEFDALRRQYVAILTPLLAQMTEELLSLPELEVRYLPGWDESQDYEEVLAENAGYEYALGHTQYGPHRADLDLRINGLSIKHFLSRGQQKLLICAMIIAQGIVFFKHINKGLIYLIDDLPAELDLHSKTNLISLLSRQKMQVFITAIESKMIETGSNLDVATKVFHVEHGKVRCQDKEITG